MSVQKSVAEPCASDRGKTRGAAALKEEWLMTFGRPQDLAFLVARLGPYHAARLTCTMRVLGSHRLVALEVARHTREYAWDSVELQGIRRRTLVADREYEDVPARERARLTYRALEDEGPGAVAVAGWGFAESRAAVRWCRARRRVAVVMSDSQERDTRRTWLKEAVKRRVLRDCDAAFVGGESHARYLEKLGMGPERIVRGYNVVDNDYFSHGADAARRAADALRRAHKLPADYFLCSARFISKKSLPLLLAAFATYKTEMGSLAWDLVVLGDGPLRDALEAQRSALRLDGSVHFPGFRQYEELPAYYGLARTFVLPSLSEQWGLVVNEAMAAGLPVLVSEACGAAELVKDGENGYRFKPGRPDQLASLLVRVTRDPKTIASMGVASRRIISGYSLESFAEGLARATQIGTEYLSRRTSRLLPNPVLWF
jgi:glycosyltransferase involved in cell wall biosynthesis